MSSVIYVSFAGLHINAEVDEAIKNIILDVAKMQTSSHQDFASKFQMLEIIMADKRTSWIRLTFIPDWSRVTECHFSDQIAIPKYDNKVCKNGVNTFVWAKNYSVLLSIRQAFMISALSTSLRYNIRSIYDLDVMRAYLNEFQQRFFKAIDEGVFIHGDLSETSIVKPHVYSSSSYGENPYDECKWLEEETADDTIYSTYVGVPPKYWSTSNITTDTGTRNR